MPTLDVFFSLAAKADLIEIGDYIAKNSPRRAITFVRESREVALRLGSRPHAFAIVPRFQDHGIRHRPYGNYLIFFRIEADKVVIVHIVHGSRDYGPLLFPDRDP